MSNARYFAQGTDFYRVLYNNGSVDGPYIKPHTAKRVGESGTKLRESYRWTKVEGKDFKEKYTWRYAESFKLQKLSAARIQCDETAEECYPSSAICLNGHGYGLKWVDFE